MILIFAVDENWNIGLDGSMLTSIKADLKRFRELTQENIVIMGRKTLEAIPGQQPLPNRKNILVTRSGKYEDQGFYILDDLDNIFDLLKTINPDGEMKVFVTGGETIADQLLPYCKKAYITKILKEFPKADTCIPNLDLKDEWKIVKKSEIQYEDDLAYQYIDYTRS